MNTLELRIKLWNQLAETGQLAISEAWYETEDQMKIWNEISEQEFADPQSNAFKELTQLDELLKQSHIQRMFDNKFTMVFDLGCGNGKKAAHVIHKIKPERTIYYIPCDTSGPLIQEAIRNQGYTQYDYASRTNTSAFLEKLEHNQFHWCDMFLREYARIPDQLRKLITNQTVRKSYDAKTTDDVFGISEAYRLANTKRDKLFSTLDALKQFKGSAAELRQAYLALYEKYNPDSAVHIEEQGTNLLEELIRNEQLSASGPYGRQVASMNIWNVGKMKTYLMRMLIDAELLPSSYAEGECGWATLPCVIQHSGLRTDFIKTNCADIAFTRYNAEQIRNRIWDRFTNHQVAQHLRERKQPPLGLFLLLGQTLGNFTQTEQDDLLKNIYLAMKPGDILVSGVELRPEIGDPHYQAKVENLVGRYQNSTAEAFMRQTARLAGIPNDSARFNAVYKDNTIEMHFEVTDPMLMIPHPTTVSRQLFIAPGTKLLTATSYKFTPTEHFNKLECAGFRIIYAPDRSELDYGIAVAQR